MVSDIVGRYEREEDPGKTELVSMDVLYYHPQCVPHNFEHFVDFVDGMGLERDISPIWVFL